MSSKEFKSKINVKDEKYDADVEDIKSENDTHESIIKVEQNEDQQNEKYWTNLTKNLPITITPKTKTSSKPNNGNKEASKFKRRGNNTSADFPAFQKEKFDLKNPSLASEKQQLERMKYLTSIGAQINSKKNNDDNTPIHKAAYRGHLEILKFLTENNGGANFVNAKNSNGMTPIHNAVSMGHLEIVKYLIEKGADVDAQNSNDMTPIHFAASKGYLEIVKCLAKNGAEIDLTKTKKGMKPIHISASEGNIEIVKYLASNGANINGKGRDDWTPIHYAAFFGHLEVVEYLAENGAEIQAPNQNKQTPVDLANNCGHIDVEEYLRLLQKSQEDTDKIPEESISYKAPCILCMQPRNGLYVLSPCGHTSLCRSCCETVISKENAKCPSCEKPVKDYIKIFFKAPEFS